MVSRLLKSVTLDADTGLNLPYCCHSLTLRRLEIFPEEELTALDALYAGGVVQHPLVLLVGGNLALKLLGARLQTQDLLRHRRVRLKQVNVARFDIPELRLQFLLLLRILLADLRRAELSGWRPCSEGVTWLLHKAHTLELAHHLTHLVLDHLEAFLCVLRD